MKHTYEIVMKHTYEITEFFADVVEPPWPTDDQMFLHDHGRCGGVKRCIVCQDDMRADHDLKYITEVQHDG